MRIKRLHWCQPRPKQTHEAERQATLPDHHLGRRRVVISPFKNELFRTCIFYITNPLRNRKTNSLVTTTTRSYTRRSLCMASTKNVIFGEPLIAQRVNSTITHNALSSFELQSRSRLHDRTILLVLLVLLPFVWFGSTLCSGVHPDLPPPFVLILLSGRITIFLVLKRRRQLSVRAVIHYPILPSSVYQSVLRVQPGEISSGRTGGSEFTAVKA